MKNNKLHSATFSILGDSYSTFAGYIPEGYACYYPQQNEVKDVLNVEDTWWHLLISQKSMVLLQNNSYSGSTVCTQVRETQPKSCSFVERVNMNFGGDYGKEPDYIFVFGGTNDSWLGRDVGMTQYEEWTEDSLKEVLPAYCYVIERLKRKYEKAKIVSVVNTELDPVIAEGMCDAASYFGATVVVLDSISKQSGHPTRIGMEQIYAQIVDSLDNGSKAK